MLFWIKDRLFVVRNTRALIAIQIKPNVCSEYRLYKLHLTNLPVWRVDISETPTVKHYQNPVCTHIKKRIYNPWDVLRPNNTRLYIWKKFDRFSWYIININENAFRSIMLPSRISLHGPLNLKSWKHMILYRNLYWLVWCNCPATKRLRWNW